MTHATKDAGFTLVEALVSLFVFSLIASGSVLLLMQSVESQRRIGEVHESLRELETARALFSADVIQMAARSVREADGTRAPAVVGGGPGGDLAFVRAAGEPDGAGAAVTSLIRVRYRFRDGALVRLSRGTLDAASPDDDVARIVLASAGEGRFEYFDGARWHAEWGSLGAPRAIALIAQTPRYGEIRIEAATGLSP
ncbi:MAG: GspJ family type II secretion system protein [Hyphomonadaceae bacterium]